MKKSIFLLVALFSLWLPSLVKSEDGGSLNEILKQTKIEKVGFNKELNMYVVQVEGASQPLYLTNDYKYLFIGKIIDVQAKKELTLEITGKAEKTFRLEFSRLPLETAVKISEGSRKLAVFLDPDCPYSRKIYPELKKLSDVAVYVFFYPLNFHPKAKTKSVSAWCAKDKAEAAEKLFTKGEIENKECESPVENHIALALQYGMKGVPAMVFEDGRIVGGYMKAEQLSGYLSGEAVSPTIKETSKKSLEKEGENWETGSDCQ